MNLVHSRAIGHLCKPQQPAACGLLCLPLQKQHCDLMSTCVLYIDESGDIRQHNVPLRNADIDGAQDYSHVRQHWPRIDALEFKSRNKYDGHLPYGFKVLRHDRVQ